MHDTALVRREHSRYTLSHLSNAKLLRELRSLVAQEQDATAVLLAHIGEVDARRLYVAAGYASMFTYCVDELRLSEDAAYRRIRAARAARQYPVLLDAIAEGRVHLAAVSAIAPHLTAANISELIEAATHRRKSEIEEMLAVRYPEAVPAPPAVVRAIPAAPATSAELVLGRVETGSDESQLVLGRVADDSSEAELVLGRVDDPEPAPAHLPAAPPPLPAAPPPPAPERFLVQVTVDRNTYDLLKRAQALLSHAVPSGDVAQVLTRALETLVAHLERRKLGVGRSVRKETAPRHGSPTQRTRYLSAQVRRAVWDRDGGRCTFISSAGHRCNERRFLEFDHVEPFARGGPATVNGLRLRCRAHNQHEADRAFGVEFMIRKREQANARSRARACEEIEDVFSGLRTLGCRVDEARRAAEFSRTQGATLEERMRAALGFLSRGARVVRNQNGVAWSSVPCSAAPS